MKNPRASLVILFSVIVLDLIGFGIVIPILPFYAEIHGASATVLGLLLTSYAAMQFLFSPLWGKLSDRIGRKKVLLLTMAGSVLGLLILGWAPNLLFLFVGRIVSGIFGANISVATAYVTDVTTEENRAKGMGLIGAAFGVGFILGPAAGGILSTHGYSTPIYFAALLSALNILYAYFRLGDPKAEVARIPITAGKILADGDIRKMCLLNFLFTLGVAQLEATFAFFMMDRFQYNAKQVAYLLVLMALIMVLVQGGLIRRLAPRFGEKRLLEAGALLLGVSFLAIPYSPTVALLLLPLSLASLGRGISQPSLLSLASKFSPEHYRGGVMGVFQSSASLARVIGPVAAGTLYDIKAPLPFYFACFILLVVLLLTSTVPPIPSTTAYVTEGKFPKGPAEHLEQV
jgi:multidrug resistance protein